jgi:HPt (histidine-containing phosphotransfer) domain-containing protein
MMAKIPKVTVTFDADLDSLKKGVKSATTEVDSFSDRVSDFGKKAALAFAAAAAAIGAFAIASVKAAAEDEASQKKLEETIRNTTAATADQIAGIDKYVTAQSIATATTDDVIRPALSRLLRATGDLTKSQELLTLSQEIAAATGKPLEAVTNAVAKSFEGSNTSLSKLGIGIDAARLKTLSFDQTQKLLNKTFNGFKSEAKPYSGVAVNLDLGFSITYTLTVSEFLQPKLSFTLTI